MKLSEIWEGIIRMMHGTLWRRVVALWLLALWLSLTPLVYGVAFQCQCSVPSKASSCCAEGSHSASHCSIPTNGTPSECGHCIVCHAHTLPLVAGNPDKPAFPTLNLTTLLPTPVEAVVLSLTQVVLPTQVEAPPLSPHLASKAPRAPPV